ncbi:hypothetical protein BLNAU_14701 [Blattamonas nauphoetae]|uniref:Protein kinase domain-containing protein n=1 Tax=Blattamonas nauphoetae TaxID=2049346 RepID=A0ABQ9XJD2_9EUKA|nr:hypothetical protein BLNAU_14701 [Blattamonas nauphoetae]
MILTFSPHFEQDLRYERRQTVLSGGTDYTRHISSSRERRCVKVAAIGLTSELDPFAHLDFHFTTLFLQGWPLAFVRDWRLDFRVQKGSRQHNLAVETDTLFNALHYPHSTRFVEKRKVGQAITKGLVSLVEMRVIADVLTRLSPHWVLFDQNDRVSLKTRERQSVVGESGIVSGGKKISEDGQRWMAPEVLQENWKQTKENVDHGAVFSLGLVLWEIETGSVPFGEVDGATAHRRLASNEKPRMEKVSESMQAIIVPCLSLDPSQRPTLKTVLSQLDELDSVPQPSNENEGNMMSKIG